MVLAGDKDAGLQVDGPTVRCFLVSPPCLHFVLKSCFVPWPVQSPVNHRLSLELSTEVGQEHVGSRDVTPRWLSSEWFAPSIFSGAPPQNAANPGLTKPAWGKLLSWLYQLMVLGLLGTTDPFVNLVDLPRKRVCMYIFTYHVSPPCLDSQ